MGYFSIYFYDCQLIDLNKLIIKCDIFLRLVNFSEDFFLNKNTIQVTQINSHPRSINETVR